jgi:hypothetical protein
MGGSLGKFLPHHSITVQLTVYSKGKQERFFLTVRLQFLPEVETSEIASLSELNESF